MKRYISYLTCALAAVLAAGCIKVDIQHYSASTVAKLQLKNTDLVETRANGIESLNENYIDNIQCFFSVNGTTVDHATGVIYIKQNDTGNGVEHPLDIPSDVLEDLFPNGATTCNLYVLANAPAVGQVATIGAIKSTVITLSKDENGALKGKQDSFVMDGSTTVTKKNDNTLAGTVNLARAAAKIEVDLKVDKQIIIGEGEAAVTWTPDLANVKITYNQSVTASTVNAEPANASARTSYAQTAQPFTFTTADALTYSTGVQKMPFYSYPSQWDDNKSATAANILLEIPWKKATETQYQTYRYQIPVNFDDMKLLRNHIYKLSINVGILGALNGEVEITPSYIVVDWKSHTINTELSRPQYLVVNENVVVMNNVDTYSVGYASSDPVTAVITKITKPDYSSEDFSTTEIYSGNGTTSVSPSTGNTSAFSVSVTDGQIVLSHALNNDNKSSGYDYVPYTITIKVTNSIGFTEYIEYTQYPAMYIKADKNPGGQASNRGYAYVYGNTTTNDGWDDIVAITSGGNHNPNMYVITTTSLDESSTFILGDSRSDSSRAGQALGLTRSYNNKTLQYYYPSRTDSEDYIAPIFRIASSYGKCNGALTHEEAIKRCAAYQEDGFPAGRWRVPTTAEMIYIAQISRKGWIPHLFSDGKNYWSATERITYSTTSDPTGNNSTNNEAFVRCVYDEWYWGTERITNKATFTWGDAQRN